MLQVWYRMSSNEDDSVSVVGFKISGKTLNLSNEYFHICFLIPHSHQKLSSLKSGVSYS